MRAAEPGFNRPGGLSRRSHRPPGHSRRRRRGHRGRFANAILTRFPVVAARAIDLAVSDYEPRAALDADLMAGDRVLRVLATHFGLHAAERRLQANRLIAALDEPSTPGRRAAHAVLLVGDLNEWRGRSGGIRALDRCLGPSAAPRTFPSWMPVLPLDRIYADGPAVLRDVHVYRSPLARLASDHLPLVASLWWTWPTAGGTRRARGLAAAARRAGRGDRTGGEARWVASAGPPG